VCKLADEEKNILLRIAMPANSLKSALTSHA
jgi:hypothetical protein